MISEKILVIDDDTGVLALLKRILTREGFVVDTASGGEMGLELFRRVKHDVVITDLKMPDINGIEVVKRVKQIEPRTEIIAMTGFASKESAIKAINSGASAYLIKPFDCLEVIPYLTLKTIEHQRLLKDNQRLIRRLRKFLWKKKQELVTFEEITDKLARLEDHEKLLTMILNRLSVELRTAGVWLWRREDDFLKFWHQSGVPGKTEETMRPIPIGRNVPGRVAKRGRMVRVRNLADSRDHYCARTALQANVRSFYAFPLLIDNHVEGVLGVYFYPRRRVSPGDVERMRSFSRQLALVMKTINLYAEILKSNNKLRQLQELMVQTESLTAMGRLASGIAHELGNPLGIISTTTQYLLDRDEDVSREELKECLSVIAEKSNEMNRFVLDMLELSKPKAFRFVPSDITDIIGNVLKFLRPRAKQQNVSLNVQVSEDIPPVYVDRVKLGQALLNIFLNALDVMPDGGTLSISATFEPRLRNVLIRISDTGPGISQENLSQIFTPFFSTKSKGTGLGLSVSRQIINTHHGTLGASNRDDGGAEFTIRLPVRGSSSVPGSGFPLAVTLMTDWQ